MPARFLGFLGLKKIPARFLGFSPSRVPSSATLAWPSSPLPLPLHSSWEPSLPALQLLGWDFFSGQQTNFSQVGVSSYTEVYIGVWSYSALLTAGATVFFTQPSPRFPSISKNCLTVFHPDLSRCICLQFLSPWFFTRPSPPSWPSSTCLSSPSPSSSPPGSSFSSPLATTQSSAPQRCSLQSSGYFGQESRDKGQQLWSWLVMRQLTPMSTNWLWPNKGRRKLNFQIQRKVCLALTFLSVTVFL